MHEYKGLYLKKILFFKNCPVVIIGNKIFLMRKTEILLDISYLNN